MPRAFSDDERVAAQDDRDVVMPSREASALEVVEPELALEIFVSAFGSPALHNDADEPLSADAGGQRREEVVGRLVFAIAPFDQQPERLTLSKRHCIVVRRHDTVGGEACAEVTLGAFAPSATAELSASMEVEGEVAHADSGAWRARRRSNG